MTQKVQVNRLIGELMNNQQFLADVKSYVGQLASEKQQNGEKVSFAFERDSKYPWSTVAGNMPIEGQKMVDQISDLISGIIEHNLHEILNRQFINISNQIIIIRDQMTKFTQQINEKQMNMKNEFFSQFEQIKKKMIIHHNTVKQKQFVRTRVSGLNSSLSASSQVKTQIKSSQLQALKKQIQILKKQISSFSHMKTVNDRITLLQETLSNQMINFKLKIQSIKQKSQKGYQQLSSKINENNSKQYISNQIKRGFKSYLKVYLQEINKCKDNMSKYQDSLAKIDKGLQDYLGNQLKSLWIQFSNMKRRMQSIEEHNNLNNQSFMME